MEEVETDHTLPRPDPDVVARVAARILGRRVQTAPVDVERLAGGFGAGQGVFRVRSCEAAWSVVLKVLGRTSESSAPERWDYWAREAEAYRAGFPERLPDELAAPRCAAVIDVDADTRWLWLEDLGDGPPLGWTLDDHAEVARALGVFNGRHLLAGSEDLPAWCSRQWLRGWVEASEDAAATFADVVDRPWVERTWPGSLRSELAATWADRERYLAILDRLPHALCHLDVFFGNLGGRRRADGGVDRVLLDWAFVGAGALGEELVPLIHVNLIWQLLTPDDVEEAERRCLAAYVEGLRSTGWTGDERLPALGYAAAGALRFGVGMLRQWLPMVVGDLPDAVRAALVRPLDEAVEMVGNGARAAQRLTAEARRLATELGLD